jgi:glyoxylase I family protein
MSTIPQSLQARIRPQTPGVHHVALRVSDLTRSKQFYTETLGFDLLAEMPGLVLFGAGETAFGLRGPAEQTPPGDRFDPFRVGLDHVALACTSEQELRRVAQALSDAGVENTGVKMDDVLGKLYVAFKDPDRISWEFYMV